MPKWPESYNALLELAEQVLDSVIEYSGMMRLTHTFTFCSSELVKAIPGRIDPKRDQHAAHELNRLGKPVCERFRRGNVFCHQGRAHAGDDHQELRILLWLGFKIRKLQSLRSRY